VAGGFAFCVLDERRNANLRLLALAALLSLRRYRDKPPDPTKLGNGIWRSAIPTAPDGFPQGNTTVVATAVIDAVIDRGAPLTQHPGA